jgi:large subunit ribosomal protein L25
VASQITLPAGVTLVSDPDTLVVNVAVAPTAAQMEGESTETGETETEETED